MRYNVVMDIAGIIPILLKRKRGVGVPAIAIPTTINLFDAETNEQLSYFWVRFRGVKHEVTTGEITLPFRMFAENSVRVYAPATEDNPYFYVPEDYTVTRQCERYGRI